ncbi:golgin candidate 5-like [Arachis duranensis]|uniref:Golgin candidate 5-like n=1 Tax=Arachis duranensis TaxID=130453 RepID=A0A6P4BYE7_ARADU|nr:golgin candidate 5-like [Arachis duranensis]
MNEWIQPLNSLQSVFFGLGSGPKKGPEIARGDFFSLTTPFCASLAEELVKMTEQCEKLRGEAAVLPGLRSELEALRRRHSAALELMGERDEELEELRADIVDLKEMYREQVNLLVNQIQRMNPSMGNTNFSEGAAGLT